MRRQFIARRRGQHARATQDGADARHQFARHEGLAQIIVGPHFQANDAVDLVGARRQHQHRDACPLAGAQGTEQRQAVFARQHQVKDNKVDGGRFAEHTAHLPAVARCRHAKTVALQIVGQQFAYALVVIDDEDVIGTFFHGRD